MKIRHYGLIVGACILAACGQRPGDALNATCDSVMTDQQVRSDIVRAGLTVETYCDCATAQLLDLPEAERDKAIESFKLIETTMQAREGDAEAAFESIRIAARQDGALPDAILAYQNLDALGDQLDDMLEAMEEAGGACPA
ncbi:MAG: hypothetical protein AAGJ51_00440 [Pseudomonadota bacterium]